VKSVDALACGLALIDLGGGRRQKEDAIDHGAGLTIESGVGERVARGAALVHIHASSEQQALLALNRLESAWQLVADEVERPPHMLYRVDRERTRAAVPGTASATRSSRVVPR
jgi:thymidine phosphorylase